MTPLKIKDDDNLSLYADKNNFISNTNLCEHYSIDDLNFDAEQPELSLVTISWL